MLPSQLPANCRTADGVSKTSCQREYIGRLGFRTEQPRRTGLEAVVAATPTGRQTGGGFVFFENFDLSALTRILPSTKPGDAAADDDDLPGIFSHASQNGIFVSFPAELVQPSPSEWQVN